MAMSLPGAWKEGCASMSMFIASARDPTGKRRRLNVKAWTSVKDVKDQLQTIYNAPSSRQRLFFGGKELKNTRTLQECGIYKDGFTILFKIEANYNGIEPRIQPYGASHFPRDLVKTLHKAQQGLSLGLAPVLSMEGTGGTYFLRGPTQRYIACFKPQDEEPFAQNNPRGFVGNIETGSAGLRKGVLAGEACIREVAAYLLDKNHFSSVPATALAEAMHPSFNYTTADKHPKLGSFQEFIQHDDVVGDLSPTIFSAREVHKIAILDIRLVNSDRNDANILVRKRRIRVEEGTKVSYELIPIDHGYCLGDVIEIAWCDWCWFDWPQVKEPIDSETRDYILALDPEKDARELKTKLSLRSPCLFNMRLAGTLLKKGVRAGISLYEIACIMCRQDLDVPSPLEQMIERAVRMVNATLEIPLSPLHATQNGEYDEEIGKLSIRLSSSALFAASPCNSPCMNQSLPSFPMSPVASDCGSNHLDDEHGAPSSNFVDEFLLPPAQQKKASRPQPIDVSVPLVHPIVTSPPGFWASHPPYRSEWDRMASDALHDAARDVDNLVSPASEQESYSPTTNTSSSACGDAVSSVEMKEKNGFPRKTSKILFEKLLQNDLWANNSAGGLFGIDGECKKQVYFFIEILMDKEIQCRVPSVDS